MPCMKHVKFGRAVRGARHSETKRQRRKHASTTACFRAHTAAKSIERTWTAPLGE